MNRLIIAFFILVISIPLHAKTIVVKTQADFDVMGQSVISALKACETSILVDIKEGIYIFHDKHLNFSAQKYPNASIVFKGENAVILGSNNVEEGLAVDPQKFCYVTKDYQKLRLWSDVIQLDSDIEILSRDKKTCRLKLPKTHMNLGDNQYLRITEWFTIGQYKITNIANGSIYFTADDLNESDYGYNVNWDKGYGWKHPRIQVSLGEPSKYSHVCRISQFFSTGGAVFKSLVFDGLKFWGSGGDKSLFMFSNVKADNICFQNCSFRNINGYLVYLVRTSNFVFQNNAVTDCEGVCVKSESESCNTQIIGNRFSNSPMPLSKLSILAFTSDNFLVRNNVFKNFSANAISCGLHYSMNKEGRIRGLIESNEFYFDKEYLKAAERHSLMDGGAIYVLTQTDGITIRNNYIHDISGVKDNRGIFCDDGAKNVSITGNVIQRIQNSYCIDLRKVKSVAEKVPDHNTGNTCIDNLVDGDIRFYLRDGSCKESNNKKIGDRGYKTMKAYKNWEGKIK